MEVYRRDLSFWLRRDERSPMYNWPMSLKRTWIVVFWSPWNIHIKQVTVRAWTRAGALEAARPYGHNAWNMEVQH